MPVKTLIEGIREALDEEMARDERVWVLGEDVGKKGGVFLATDGLYEKYGEARVLDTPLAESCIVGVAIGSALNGLVPVAEIQFADFIHPAFDQIVSEAARIRYRSNGDYSCPITIRSPYGGGVHGGLYHSQSVEAFYAHVPGLKVVMPSCAADGAGLLRSAIADPNPVVLVEHKSLYFRRETVAEDLPPVPIGRARVRRRGDDVTIIATSRMVDEALEAAERLSARGIEAEVIDPRTLVPLDVATLGESVRRTGRAVVAHEAVRVGGFGSELLAQVHDAAFECLEAPIQRVGAPFTPVPASPPLEDAYRPGAAEIEAAAREALEWDAAVEEAP
jgi:2-oxoisovalerate dehydrogenase E1 component beta subunit